MFKEMSKDVAKFTLNPHVRWILVLVLIMYVFSLDQFITKEGDLLLKSTGVKLVVILLVVLLADRDPFMAVLLAVAYLVSLHSLPYIEGMETKMKSDDSDHSDDKKEEKQNKHNEACALVLQAYAKTVGKTLGLAEGLEFVDKQMKMMKKNSK